MKRFIILIIMALGAASGQLDDEYEEVPSTHMPHLLSTSSVIQATAGEAVTFPCDVDDLGDFVLLWKKGKQRVLFAGDLRIFRDDRFKVVDKTSLQISAVNSKDTGEYICQISSNPPQELSHNLDVLYPPTVKPRSKVVETVKEGETVTLSCDATGNPAPVISWKRGERYYDNTDGTDFLITNAQKGDSGEYQCIADNTIGDPATATITVEVVSAPKVYPNPKSGYLVVKEGEPISISCEATGDPMPVITWKSPGGEKAQKTRDGDKIVISEASRNHAGSYECIANNSMGIFTSAIIRVEVLYAPEVKVPEAWIHSGEGTTVNITCIVRGEPMPSVMWKKGESQIIHSSARFHLKTADHHHILQIHDLQEDDFGRYACIASNSLSSSSQNVHIIGTPQVPSFTSKPHGSQGTKYTISWMVKSSTPVDEYSLMYRKKSSTEEWELRTVPATEPKDGDTQTQMFQLLDLMPATSYEAVVTAKNKFGWSKQSEALVFTTKHEVVLEPSPTTEETALSPIVQTEEAIVNVVLELSPTTEETTLSPIVQTEEAIVNDKRSEAMSNSCARNAWNIALVAPIVFIMFYRHLH